MDNIEQMKEMQKEFLSGNLNFPTGSHESVAKVLGLPVDRVTKIREARNIMARARIKVREAIDAENVKHTIWDNRGCDLMQASNRLTVRQLKELLANLPDDMNVYTHQYLPAVGMETLPCETIKIVNNWEFGQPDKTKEILELE